MESAPAFDPPAWARKLSVFCTDTGCRPLSLKLPMWMPSGNSASWASAQNRSSAADGSYVPFGKAAMRAPL